MRSFLRPAPFVLIMLTLFQSSIFRDLFEAASNNVNPSITTNNIVVGIAAAVSTSQRYSYSSPGMWQLSDAPHIDCTQHFLCTPSNYTWKSNHKFYDKVTGCDALLSKGVKTIFFHGDSFMRQMYQALFITLSGNYRNGSLVNSDATASCEYQKQFNEKKCGVKLLNHAGWVCDGKILLDPLLIGVDSLTHCTPASSNSNEKKILLWSFGNYKTGRHGRHGINNATAYSQLFEGNPCPHILNSKDVLSSDQCSVWWISTHYRIKGYFPDESPEMIKSYNEGMRSFFESGKCGHVNYVDVYNMTRSLMTTPGDQGKPRLVEEANSMTYDSVHWGLEVNLIKAQIILNALLEKLM